MAMTVMLAVLVEQEGGRAMWNDLSYLCIIHESNAYCKWRSSTSLMSLEKLWISKRLSSLSSTGMGGESIMGQRMHSPIPEETNPSLSPPSRFPLVDYQQTNNQLLHHHKEK